MNTVLRIAWIVLAFALVSQTGWAQDPSVANNDPVVEDLIEAVVVADTVTA